MTNQLYEGTYLIVKCCKRHDDKGVDNGGWYRIFGAGGFWHVPLLDRRASDTGDPPYRVGQALMGVRLRPLQEPRAVAKRVARLDAFSLLVPRACDITLAEL